MVERRLILWDIDGTMLSLGPAAGIAFDLAVERVVGRDPSGHDVSMGGKTDPQIALEILATMALSDGEARHHLPDVLEALERELEAAVDEVRRTGRVLPGARELIERLGNEPGVLQTLLTGNLAANARLKLGAFGLDRLLDLKVAATGSDHADRDRLVPVALEKAERVRGLRFAPEETWIIGDTPRDLACARAAGARCLLVSTGRVPIEELEGLGADAVMTDLTDTDRTLAVLGLDREREPRRESAR
jgi:phosphoglycolate phosphatase-like HAD superfamily hydrolase